MKNKPKKQRKAKQRPIPASVILSAESSRLFVMSHGVPENASHYVQQCAWAMHLAAAFLESLGAPERLVRYYPETKQPNKK